MLIWVLAGVVALILVAVGVALAFTLPVRGHAEVSPTSSVTQTTRPSGPQWVELKTPDFPGVAETVAVSDDALVVDTAKGLYACPIDESGVGLPTRLPVSGGEAGSPTLDGTLVAWWEGTLDEASNVFVDHAIYAMRLPDGSPVQVVGYDRAPYRSSGVRPPTRRWPRPSRPPTATSPTWATTVRSSSSSGRSTDDDGSRG